MDWFGNMHRIDNLQLNRFRSCRSVRSIRELKHEKTENLKRGRLEKEVRGQNVDAINKTHILNHAE